LNTAQDADAHQILTEKRTELLNDITAAKRIWDRVSNT